MPQTPRDARILAGRTGRAGFDDVQSMMDRVLRDWTQECFQISPGPGSGQHMFVETEGLRLDASHWSTGVLIRGEGAPESVCIGLVDGDPASVRFRGRPVAPARIPLVQSAVEFEFASVLPTAALVLTVDRAVFQRHANAMWGRELAPGAAYMLALPGIDQGLVLVQRLKAMLAILHQQSPYLASPRVAALATDKILSELLASAAMDPQRVVLPHRHHLARDAAAYLRAVTDQPVSIRQLCELLDVNWRTLDQGFLELYGVTPKAYMRVARLHHVRRALSAADPADRTVTDIAVSWGFFQLGRFAVEYRRLFGEKPSDTLWKRQTGSRDADGSARPNDVPIPHSRQSRRLDMIVSKRRSADDADTTEGTT
ncbi:helix-turn-helix domain-containing protein (plasmid) [Skermanella rosea]|uniref:helix-turn-helix domain-containing protein n=1 Tax=Skermanella rosea TaxID=1817965 RepID=UPI0019329547|nr:helix-turn-helix domain-containing protein [Skermanella rosea]UEM07434.1 helix-turn-helix domain-containing protein [Skermanella rosea]